MPSKILYLTAPGQPSFDEEVAQGQPEVENPFGEAEPTAEIYSQVYMQRAGSYRRPSENSRCPVEIARGRLAYFVDDSARVPLGVADLVTWTRTWATKPATITEYDQINVLLPARGGVYYSSISPNYYPFTAGKAYTIPTRATIFRAFFLVGVVGVGDYTSETGIPTLNETIATSADVTARGAGPFDSAEWTALTSVSQNVGIFSGAVLQPPNPTGVGNFVAGGLASGNYYVGQSQLRRYQGNIWERIATRITI